jgi:hypothetical protein
MYFYFLLTPWVYVGIITKFFVFVQKRHKFFCTSKVLTRFQPRTCGNLIDQSWLFYHYARSMRKILSFPKHYSVVLSPWPKLNEYTDALRKRLLSFAGCESKGKDPGKNRSHSNPRESVERWCKFENFRAMQRNDERNWSGNNNGSTSDANRNTMERRCHQKELKHANIVRLILVARDFQFNRSTMCKGNTKKTQSNADLPSFLQSE